MNKLNKSRLATIKPSTESISIRLPEQLLRQIKIMALKRDVPYQSLMKIILADAVENELYGTGLVRRSQRKKTHR